MCNLGCGCGNELVPVCGSDNAYYYSACHAGCAGYGGADEAGIVVRFPTTNADANLHIQRYFSRYVKFIV